MAGASLLALLDDIATLLDDIGTMTKTAASKTAGVVGDDLAVNAEQFGGIRAERELPVVWAVAKGSFLNKLILAPAAILLSAVAPWAVIPILMAGGAYLCLEGFEKTFEKFTGGHEKHEGAEKVATLLKTPADLVAFEKEKIKGAIRTDFVLSAEIIVIALGTVAEASLAARAATVGIVSVAITAGVYLMVAGIIKVDDLGLYLLRGAGKSKLRRKTGRGLLKLAPLMMKTIAVGGTAAMFMVGGGIIIHGLPHTLTDPFSAYLGTGLTGFTVNALFGIAAGGVFFGILSAAKPLFKKA